MTADIDGFDSVGDSPRFDKSMKVMTIEERQKKRKERKLAKQKGKHGDRKTRNHQAQNDTGLSDVRTSELLASNEDELLNFVAKINKVYQDKLKKPAPFMTFVFCGMQSAGKSTLMERFLNAVVNIVQEGTGTRCPLDTTCIHDSSLSDPVCDLSGEELDENQAGEKLTVNQVFERITNLNKKLAAEDRFSTSPLYLVYRANNVQNMRFVDTPGIITTDTDTGKDNREDIKEILRSEMNKPNTKLCVLLEPKEFQTNSIVDFCDSTLGNRSKWLGSAILLMTKFDKQLEDSRTGSKANAFFEQYLQNKCYPHLVITPTLPKENLPGQELFKARKELLMKADLYEMNKFQGWCDGHQAFHHANGDELLDKEIFKKLGFPSAKKAMREIMLNDTTKRLPEVLSSLREELAGNRKELKDLEKKQKFTDPRELKWVVLMMSNKITQRIKRYLDGDIESGIKFPNLMQTLDDEIDLEEDSDWASKELNHFSEVEDEWRQRIAEMEDYPDQVYADNEFLGGKQYQRAVEFFHAVMLEALPDVSELKPHVANVTGYLSDGLHRENWEHAMVEIIRVTMRKVSHPGINYLVKHVGSIFRRLFTLALEDVKRGNEFSSTFKLVPSAVEKFLVAEFEEMLWERMCTAANKTHASLMPKYSTIDPNLPTFRQARYDTGTDEDPKYVKRGDKFELVQNKEEKAEETWQDWAWKRMEVLASASGKKAKEFMKSESKERALTKKSFLKDERTPMITGTEIDFILFRSFQYLVALMDFILLDLKFSLNHYMYAGFKEELNGTFNCRVSNANWETLVEEDPKVTERISELKDRITGIEDSLKDVEAMYRKL